MVVISVLAATLLIALGSFAYAGTKECEQPRGLTFSMVPLGDVERAERLYGPLLKRIEKMTSLPVTSVRPSSYASVVEGLLGGRIDIALLGPATYIEARSGDERITPFATTEKNESSLSLKGPYYESLLVVLADSRYFDVAALKGARLALTDPGSTSGALLPRKQMSPRLGMPLEKHFGTVFFSGSHGKSLQALLNEQADAAFISSSQLEKAKSAGQLSDSKIRILWNSEPIPYDPFVYRGQLCKSLRSKIDAAFLGDESTNLLHELLDDLKAKRFIRIEDSHYEGIRKILGP